MPIELVMPSSHLILCHPLLLLPSIFPSIRVFSNESALHIRWPEYESALHIRWPEYWSFSFNIISANEYSGLIYFKDGLVGSPWSPRDSQESSQHHSSKASILWHSAFFIVKASHPYMTTGNTAALTRWNFISK